MNVLRITRHSAEEAQVQELNRIYGEVEITEVSETMPTGTREFVTRFDELAADAEIVEAVLPPNLLEAALKFSEFAKRGGQIIRAAMNREVDDDGNATFVFDHYERVVKVEVVTERL